MAEDKTDKLGEAVIAISDTSDAALAGLLGLLRRLHEAKTISDDDVRYVGDIVTSMVPAQNHAGVDRLFPMLVPGYQRKHPASR